MSDNIVSQAISEWLAAYKQEHLKGCKGEAFKKEQDWCNWLKAHAPEKFQAYLLGTGRLSTSVQTMRTWWKTWIEDNFIRLSLVEEWRDDYNGRKKA